MKQNSVMLYHRYDNRCWYYIRTHEQGGVKLQVTADHCHFIYCCSRSAGDLRTAGVPVAGSSTPAFCSKYCLLSLAWALRRRTMRSRTQINPNLHRVDRTSDTIL